MPEFVGEDFDGVILNSNEALYVCLGYAFEKAKAQVPLEVFGQRVSDKWGQNWHLLIDHVLQEHSESIRSVAKSEFDKEYFGGTYLEWAEPVPGIHDFLNWQREQVARRKADLVNGAVKTGGFVTALVTGQNKRFLKKKIFRHFDLPPDAFTHIFSASKLGNLAKPHPYALNSVLSAEDIHPERAIFVGDSERDVEFARKANVKPVVVTETGELDDEQARALKVDLLMPSIAYLPEYLDQIDAALVDAQAMAAS